MVSGGIPERRLEADSPHTLGTLADPSLGHGSLNLDDRPTDVLLGMYRRMLLIRRTEEQVAELATSGEAKCPCHLAIGQEACAVGVATALRSTDRSFGAHRSHSHYIALGGLVNEMLAEVLGKYSGCSRGMGGSMHLIAPEVGLLGTVPIVGATIPMAVGAALAATLDGSGAVAVGFFGDGATEEGVFHESMNIAATMKLPVLFACENNLFSSHLHISLRQPADRLSRYADAHRMASETLDGNDVCAVAAAAQRAAHRARTGGGPTFLEMITYRWRGHVGPREDMDVGVKRGAELAQWKARDPIGRLGASLMAARSVSKEQLATIDDDVNAEVRSGLEFARAAAYPPPSATTDYLYTPAAV